MLLQRLVSNFKPITRNDTMEGREFLVVPMVMMVEGVHQGSSGPLYYPAEELAKVPVIWNQKPVVVYHPSENGQGISACSPEVLSNRKIGVIMNTVFEEGKLKSEAWLDVERVKQIDNRIWEAIEENQMLELSTGLFTDMQDEEGEFEGDEYIGIAINYRPDHLAILPDMVGACSMEDGAGFLRLNAEHELTVDKTSMTRRQRAFYKKNETFLMTKLSHNMERLITNELSHSEISEELRATINKKTDEDIYVWIENVYDTYFIYEQNNALFKMDYAVEDEIVKLSGIPMTVEKSVVYKDASGNLIVNANVKAEKELKMNKKEFIDGLIANEATHWQEEDRDSLMAMDEAVLNKLEPIAPKVKTKVETNAAAVQAAAEAGAAGVATPAKKEDEVLTTEQYISNAPAEMQDVLRNGVQAYDAEKKRLVNVITANEKNPFTEAQLMAKKVEELQQIATLAHQPVADGDTVVPLFNGQQDPVNNDGGEVEEALVPPVMTFD